MPGRRRVCPGGGECARVCNFADGRASKAAQVCVYFQTQHHISSFAYRQHVNGLGFSCSDSW